MSNTKTRTPGTRWARCARWLGVDHNPLRRTADRIEAGLWLAVVPGLVHRGGLSAAAPMIRATAHA